MMVGTSEKHHPVDDFFYTDAMPSVWCPGCGIGTVVHAFLQSIKEAGLDSETIRVVSGFGCTGNVADYLNMDTHWIEDGTVFSYAAQLSEENQDLKIVVFSNITDFLKTGAQDFIEIQRHSTNLLIIHTNNFFYIVTEKGMIPTSPYIRKLNAECGEVTYNIPLMAKACGATYIARWTPFHAGWLRFSIQDGLSRRGFSMVEVVSPCLLYHANEKWIGNAGEQMKFYNDNTVIESNISIEDLDIKANQKIIVGKFLDRG